MEKKLTVKEAMELTNQLIQRKMVRTGRTYKEVSQEFRHKLQEKMQQNKVQPNEEVHCIFSKG